MNQLPNRLPRRLQRDLRNFTTLLRGGAWINAPSVCEGSGSGTAEQRNSSRAAPSAAVSLGYSDTRRSRHCSTETRHRAACLQLRSRRHAPTLGLSPSLSLPAMGHGQTPPASFPEEGDLGVVPGGIRDAVSREGPRWTLALDAEPG